MKKPTAKVTNLAITRKGYVYTAKWKVPSTATADTVKSGGKTIDNPYKFTSLNEQWRIDETNVKKDPLDLDKVGSGKDTEFKMSINAFVASRPKNKRFTRASFYPYNGKPKLNGIIVSVQGANSAGKGPWVSKTFKFKLPKAPSVSWSYDGENGRVTVTVKTDAGEGAAERHDTMIRTAVRLGDGTENQIKAWGAVTNTSWSATYDTSSYAADFANGEYLEFRCWAYARGFRGDNPSKAKAVYKSRIVGAPNPATIQDVTVSSKEETGRVRVGLKVGARTSSVELQRRHGEDGSWDDVDGAEDNGTCTALYDSVGLASPVRGERIYYRVVSHRDNFTVTSEPFWAEALFTAAATATTTDVDCTALAGDDGVSANAVFSWDGEPNVTGKSGIEVSWSESADAWESTDQPKTFEAEWEDAEAKAGYEHSMSIQIRGLSQGETSYIRGRKYIETDVGRSWSGYSAPVPVTPAARPAGVSLEAPSYVAQGEAIPLTWTFDGDSEQTEWHVFEEGNDSAPIAEGIDASGSASVPPERYEGKESISLYVTVGAGGDLTASESQVVGIATRPNCSISAAEQLQSMQGAQFTATTTSPDAILVCRCESAGIGPQGPLGDDEQFDGDMVWTATVSPEWAASGVDGEYTATVTIDDGTHFIDGCGYRLEVQAVDSKTSLASEAASAAFSVAWAHQAPVPSDDISVLAGADGRSVEITLVAPDGAAEGDMYDLYRGTATGFELIAPALLLDDVLTDRFAPFSDGSLAYRVATRTADGDTAWKDYYYELPCEMTRFDWPGGSAEFGWSLDFRDTFKKSFSKRLHMDGSIGGAYNAAIDVSGSYTARIIKQLDEGAMENLMAMAQYPNSIYCRRPDGHAFQCNVDIDLGNRMWSMLAEPSFSVERVSLTRQFMVAATDIVGAPSDEPEAEEGGEG